MNTHRTAVGWACLLAVVATAPLAADEPPANVRAYLEASKQQLPEKLAELKTRSKNAKDDINNINRRGRVDPRWRGPENHSPGQWTFRTASAKAERLAHYTKVYDVSQDTIAAIERTGVCVPTVPADELAVGKVGMLVNSSGGAVHLEILQVVDDNNVIAKIYRRTVWITGLPAAGIADDEQYEFAEVIEVVGTKQYTTVLGGTKTVLEIKPFDVSLVGKYLRDNMPEQPPEPSPPKEDPKAKAENAAKSKLQVAKSLLKSKPDDARTRLEGIVADYPETAAAKEAVELLKSLK